MGVVPGMDVGAGVAVPGAGVRGTGVVVPDMPVAVTVPVFIPGVAPGNVDVVVPATGERVGVEGFPGHVAELLCGERTMPVAAMSTMSMSDELWCCRIFAVSRMLPVTRERTPRMRKTCRRLRILACRALGFACCACRAPGCWRFNREVLHSSQKIVVSGHGLLQLRH